MIYVTPHPAPLPVMPNTKRIGTFTGFQSNPQTIGRNSEVTVGVFGGYPPFTWTVSGNGFSLADEETSERNNVLISSSTACGAASINCYRH